MPVKLFVGNLPHGSQQSDLENLFSQYGQITECTIMGNYGFVHMATEIEANAAITDLSGFNFMGLPLSVEFSKSVTGKKTGKGIPDRTGLTKIFIGNIKEGTTNEDMRSLFETYGEVAEADVCGGFGFVHMKEHSSALKAIKALKGYLLNGNRLNIELSTKSTQGRSKSGTDEFGYDEYGAGSYPDMRGNFRGRVLRGKAAGPPRFDPYKNNGPPRRPPLIDYPSGSSMYPPQHRQPLLQGASAHAGTSDSFARELLDLYLKNPAAFDRYARDPLVQQSLNLGGEAETASTDPFYRPPREYYEKKIVDERLETMPVTYPNVPMPGLSRVDHSGGMGMPRHSAPRPPMMGQRSQRMPGLGNGPHLYTSFD